MGKHLSTRLNERRKLNVLEMKFLRSINDVTKMNRLRNEEVKRRVSVRGKMNWLEIWSV